MTDQLHACAGHPLTKELASKKKSLIGQEASDISVSAGAAIPSLSITAVQMTEDKQLTCCVTTSGAVPLEPFTLSDNVAVITSQKLAQCLHVGSERLPHWATLNLWEKSQQTGPITGSM